MSYCMQGNNASVRHGFKTGRVKVSLDYLVFIRFFDVLGNLGNVKEKPTRKTCFCRPWNEAPGFTRHNNDNDNDNEFISAYPF